jgi:hypothetical protein
MLRFAQELNWAVKRNLIGPWQRQSQMNDFSQKLALCWSQMRHTLGIFKSPSPLSNLVRGKMKLSDAL